MILLLVKHTLLNYYNNIHMIDHDIHLYKIITNNNINTINSNALKSNIIIFNIMLKRLHMCNITC